MWSSVNDEFKVFNNLDFAEIKTSNIKESFLITESHQHILVISSKPNKNLQLS
jgi:hypothetical protein